jgi:hypothetical protein
LSLIYLGIGLALVSDCKKIYIITFKAPQFTYLFSHFYVAQFYLYVWKLLFAVRENLNYEKYKWFFVYLRSFTINLPHRLFCSNISLFYSCLKRFFFYCFYNMETHVNINNLCHIFWVWLARLRYFKYFLTINLYYDVSLHWRFNCYDDFGWKKRHIKVHFGVIYSSNEKENSSFEFRCFELSGY